MLIASHLLMPHAPLGPTVLSHPVNLSGAVDQKLNFWAPVAAVPRTLSATASLQRNENYSSQI
jgi:hypothetical protein